jgi:hypothetical protein
VRFMASVRRGFVYQISILYYILLLLVLLLLLLLYTTDVEAIRRAQSVVGCYNNDVIRTIILYIIYYYLLLLLLLLCDAVVVARTVTLGHDRIYRNKRHEQPHYMDASSLTERIKNETKRETIYYDIMRTQSRTMTARTAPDKESFVGRRMTEV